MIAARYCFLLLRAVSVRCIRAEAAKLMPTKLLSHADAGAARRLLTFGFNVWQLTGMEVTF